jgi:hypothetical protein
MAKKPKQKSEAASVAPQVIADSREQKSEPIRYVVLREGHRVSEEEYESPDDPRAIAEMEWWRKIAQTHSWGEPVEIVQYDNKLHRIW